MFRAITSPGKKATRRLMHWQARADRIARGRGTGGVRRQGFLSRLVPGAQARRRRMIAGAITSRMNKSATKQLVMKRRTAKRTGFGAALGAGGAGYARYRYQRKQTYGY